MPTTHRRPAGSPLAPGAGHVTVAREHPAGYDRCPAGDGGSGDGVVTGELAELIGAVDGGGPAGSVAGGGDGELAELSATLRTMDRLAARAVALAGQLDGRRAAAEEGMTVDGALRLHTGAVGSDVAMVLTAAEVLRSMPATAGLLADGVLSWGHVRALVLRVRRLDAAARGGLDGHLGGQADRLRALDGDRRLWALEDAIDQHTPLRTVEDRADRQVEQTFFALQGRLDGSGSGYGEFDPDAFASIADALTGEADAPRAAPCPSDGDDGDGDGGPAEPVVSRAQQLGAALVRLCTRRGDRDAGAGGPVRISVIVDLDRITDTAAGEIAAGVRGRPPPLVGRTLDRLACDAALDVVLRDGTDLLAARRYAPQVAAATRRAVLVRDGGCRFPACTAPASWCDVHHLQPRAAGGDHAVGNLVALCRRHHTTVHRRGWTQTLTVDGAYTLRRRGRRWTTLARHAQQLPPPDTDPSGNHRPAARDGPVARDGPAAGTRDGPAAGTRDGPVPRDRPDRAGQASPSLPELRDPPTAPTSDLLPF
jgi:hypothetical protein